MAVSPRSSTLYRTAQRAVILAGFGLMLAQIVPAQSAARKEPPKGPRALGLLELTSKGKARLVPITILYDGEFYDAGAYKASPVPMALESGTVYEALRNGVSEGLFTVSSATQTRSSWIGNGTWQSARDLTAAAAAAAKKKEAQSKPAPEPVEGPPVLRRASVPKTKPAEEAPPAAPNPAPVTSAPPATPPPAAAPAPSTPAPAVAEVEDPDRPVLKRGVPSPAERKEPSATAAEPPKRDPHPPSTAVAAAAGAIQLIPAISDADGPDPRPYAYGLKPDEEQKLRKKVLALAAAEVRARATQLAAAAALSQPEARTASKPGKARPPEPIFEDLQLRAFDLSNSNEPVVVLTTKARMPARPGATADLQYMLTLVARDDMYGDLHQAFSSITDNQHLDALPRMDLIDAVDADGDGRGELLFRQTSDAGSAFVVYRVIGDRLWPLFQGTPGQ